MVICLERGKWFAYGPADATATPSSLASLKSRMVMHFVCWLTQMSWKNAIKWVFHSCVDYYSMAEIFTSHISHNIKCQLKILFLHLSLWGLHFTLVILPFIFHRDVKRNSNIWNFMIFNWERLEFHQLNLIHMTWARAWALQKGHMIWHAPL